MSSSKRQKVDVKKDNDNAALTGLIQAIGTALTEKVKPKQNSEIKPSNDDPFASATIPSTTVQNYLMRFKFLKFTEYYYIIMLIYMDRLINKEYVLTEYNIHRVMAVALLVAMKFHDDKAYRNTFFAGVAGVSAEELNLLEKEFLFAIKFDLNITPKLFRIYQDECNRLVGNSQSDDTEATNEAEEKHDKDSDERDDEKPLSPRSQKFFHKVSQGFFNKDSYEPNQKEKIRKNIVAIAAANLEYPRFGSSSPGSSS